MQSSPQIQSMLETYQTRINPYWCDTLAEINGCKTFVSASGCQLTDAQGELWLDLVSNYGAASIGHNHPVVSKTISDYLLSDPAVIQPWGVNLLSAQLADRLCKYSVIEDARVVFLTTGSEAIESAMKMAMSASGREHCIAFSGGFHGLTIEATKLMGESVWSQPFQSKTINQQALLNKQLSDSWIEQLGSEKYAAVVIELVQGIGGGICWSQQELMKLQELCHSTQTLIIVDEVQTGIGRCGDWYCSNLYLGFEPDMIVVSKGLSAGFMPLSAVLVRKDIHHALYGGTGCARIHGSTFSGNSLAMTTAMSVMDVIEMEKLMQVVSERSSLIFAALIELHNKYPVIQSIDGKGLLIAIQFSQQDPTTAAYVFQLLMENNIIVNLAAHRENTIKLTPAFTISKQEINDFLEVFEAILQHISDDDNEVA